MLNDVKSYYEKEKYVQYYLQSPKTGGVKIDTRKRTIYYEYQKDEALMQNKKIVELCNCFGFGRQAEIRE